NADKILIPDERAKPVTEQALLHQFKLCERGFGSGRVKRKQFRRPLIFLFRGSRRNDQNTGQSRDGATRRDRVVSFTCPDQEIIGAARLGREFSYGVARK